MVRTDTTKCKTIHPLQAHIHGRDGLAISYITLAL